MKINRYLIGGLGLTILAGSLIFLWQPLFSEGRLGRWARARRKIIAIMPNITDNLRLLFHLPTEEDYYLLNKEISYEIRKNLTKLDKSADQLIIDAALALMLYQRPELPEVAFPVDPGQSPLEMANDQRLLDEVIQLPKKRETRNRLIWKYLDKYSEDDWENQVEKAVEEAGRKLPRRYNLLTGIELKLRERQLKSRAATAYRNTKNNLQAAGVTVAVRFNPEDQEWERKTAKLEITSKRFSSVIIDSVNIELTATPSGVIDLYRDTNSNGEKDSGDRRVGRMEVNPKITVAADGTNRVKLKLEGLDQLIYAKMEIARNSGVDPYYGIPMFDGDRREMFFLESDKEPLADLGWLELKVRFKNAITGRTGSGGLAQFINDENLKYQTEINVGPREFLVKNPEFLLKSGEERPVIFLRKGNYVFQRTVIVPRGVILEIAAGTILQFMERMSLVSYSPIIARGTAAAPINFNGWQGAPWGALAVVDTGGEISFFEWVKISGAAPARVNGAVFSGGLSAHYADAEIYHSVFSGNHGDDGVNIKYGRTIIADSRFINNDFDGLDLDMVSGEVKGNEFIGNGNDGMDISWNKAIISGNLIQDNGDKCLSIGERSTGTVSGNVIKNCPIGIAVKDMSDVLLNSNIIQNNGEGLSLYQKKEIFGGATVRLKDNVFDNNEIDRRQDRLSEVIDL